VGVLSNCDLNQVTWEQRVLAGDPEYLTTQEVPRVDFAAYAQQLGLRGVVVDRPDRVASAWDEALSADRPTLIEFVTDPNVPPLPPHITVEQARKYVKSMFKGDPHRWGALKQSVKHMAAAVKP